MQITELASTTLCYTYLLGIRGETVAQFYTFCGWMGVVCRFYSQRRSERGDLYRGFIEKVVGEQEKDITEYK